MKTISVIIACFNESENIQELYKRIRSVFKKIDYNYELIFIDNASTDSSEIILKDISTINYKPERLKEWAKMAVEEAGNL